MALIITGMHRSGTSAIARVVAAAGMTLGGGEQMETLPENPAGFFERTDVADFNDRWLSLLGGSWEAPPRDTRVRIDDLGDSVFHESRFELDLFGKSPANWFVKDPRISLLLPVWDRLSLRSLPTVLVVRQPQEVAHSLRLRNQFPLRKGLALWLAYNNAALAAARHRDTLVIDYDAAMADPSGAVSAILGFVSEHAEPEVPQVDPGDLTGLLDPGLRRQSSPQLGELDRLMAADLTDLYQGLRANHGRALPTGFGPVPEPEWAGEELDAAARLWRVRADAETLVTLARHERDGMEEDLSALQSRLWALQQQLDAVTASRSYRYAQQVRHTLGPIRQRTRSRFKRDN